MEANRIKMIAAWSLYNFAGTIYSINVISLYFALWVTIDMKGPDIFYSVAFSSSVLAAALLAPLFGFLSDRIGKRLPFLIIFSLGCFLGTAMIGFAAKLIMGLLIFAFANFCYQSGDIVANMLIPQVSKGKDVGQVSGYGTGLGYLGAVAGVLAVSPIAAHYGRQAVFIPTAVMFLLFAAPSYFLIKDPKQASSQTALKFKDILLNPMRTLLNIRQFPLLAASLLAIFLAFLIVGTIVVFMSVYLKKVAGFLDSELSIYYIASSIFAIFGGIASGFLADKIGARKVLALSLFAWCLALLLAMVSTGKLLFWIIGPLTGLNLGTTWTSSRACIADLAPREKIGEFFGFYGLAVKIAAILGPIIWGIATWSMEFLGLIKYRITLGIFLLFAILGLMVLKNFL